MKLKKAVLLGILAVSLTAPAWADDLSNSRLKSIEDKQDEILAKLTEIRSELDIIKIRSTR